MAQTTLVPGGSVKRLALPAITLFLAFLIVVLGAQNSQLKHEHAETLATIRYVHPKMWLPDFFATTIDKQTVRIGGAAGKRQIIIFLSPVCEFCDKSMPFINEMDRVARTYHDVEVIGLTRTTGDLMDDFVKRHNIKFPIAVVKEARIINLLKFGPTPAFVIVNTAGQVLYTKIGMIESSQEAALIMLHATNKEDSAESKLQRGVKNETEV